MDREESRDSSTDFKPTSANEITFDAACLFLQNILEGETRRQILAELLRAKTFTQALSRLRDSMRANSFRTPSGRVDLDKLVKTFDSQVPGRGFHIMHDWDGKADKLNEEIIPVDVLDYFIGTVQAGRTDYPQEALLAIQLDYYLLYILAVVVLKSWEEGDPNQNLDRVTHLIQLLQGPQGSRQGFVQNAETLILVATSHFEPDEKAYERLLHNVKTLNETHQVTIALVHAAILSSHLRHGFRDLYTRDLALMRSDNVPDYPWLCFSLSALMRAYARLHDAGTTGMERERVTEGIVNGLGPDTRAFVGKLPASLSSMEADHAEFASLFQKYRADLLSEFEEHRPNAENYSPISFHFNFPHNLLKAMVVNALLERESCSLTLNDLLTGIPRHDEISEAREALANTLVGYARARPDMIRGRPVPVIGYDARMGIRNFAKTILTIKELSA